MIFFQPDCNGQFCYCSCTQLLPLVAIKASWGRAFANFGSDFAAMILGNNMHNNSVSNIFDVITNSKSQTGKMYLMQCIKAEDVIYP